ncbi:MAG: S8 family serine peptidase, partial [Pseudomonadota bacterium]|nr:S8 family serine peptidase [Pseudomonadota bacterium]
MRRVLICAAVVAATWVAPLGLRTPLAQIAAAAAPNATARVIVKFRADSPLLRKQALSAAGRQTLQAAALGQRIGIALDAGRGLSDRSHVVIGHGLSSRQLAARIAGESDVEYAVADERKHIVEVPNDPLYATGPAVGATNGGPAVGQWYLKPPGAAGDAANTAPAAINAQQAWDITKGSASIVVAVLDTGLRFDHSDLQGGNVLPGYDMVSPDSAGVFTTANDGNGRDADASDPGDFVTAGEAGTLGCSQSNSSWHGTQTLGLIGAATGNNVGMASVSHGGVKVMPVRVLGKCGGFDSDIQAGILWAAGIDVPGVPHNATPARVINMSLGGAVACTQGYIDAIGQANAAGTAVVASAGNSSGHVVSSPASCPGAIGVTALRHVGDKVGFSDIGPEITISAPGGNCVNTAGGVACLYPILTTTNPGTTTPVLGVPGSAYTDSFNASLGTSFSAPLVSGTVALMLSVQPTLTPAQVKAKLQASARPFPTSGGTAGTNACVAPTTTDQLECYCTTSTCGAGMLDARAAVQAVSGVQASISLTTTTPTAGQAVSLASNSALNAGQSIASYSWTILNAGTTGATITPAGANNGASVVVTPTAAGAFVIQLATTDNTGFVSTATLSVTVVGPVVTPPASTPPPAAASSGGGALGVG